MNDDAVETSIISSYSIYLKICIYILDVYIMYHSDLIYLSIFLIYFFPFYVFLFFNQII